MKDMIGRSLTAGIINVTGYAGSETARLLRHHPAFTLAWVSGRSEAGKRLDEALPHLGPSELVIQEEPGTADVIFVALPHGAAAAVVPDLLATGARVVDLSADFRLVSAAAYREWYGLEHPRPDLLEEAVYGLCELHRAIIPTTNLIANPGCYPTAAILALAPALRAGLIEPDLLVDAKSGLSGAGRGLALAYHFSEADENCAAYAVGGHRHWPEIHQELQQYVPGQEVRLTFIPHLIPMVRGILATCYAPLCQEVDAATAADLYREAYRDEPFVAVTARPPQTKWTASTNRCLIHVTVDPRARRFIAIAALDNLIKGAAGQAIQNANLLFHLPETAGLDTLTPAYP
jgi:N-acetyl-gamma-glutamyl-phosphate reductase